MDSKLKEAQKPVLKSASQKKIESISQFFLRISVPTLNIFNNFGHLFE